MSVLSLDNLSDNLRQASPEVQQMVLDFATLLLSPDAKGQENLAIPGKPVSEDQLLAEVQASREEIAQGQGIENSQARKLFEGWRQTNQ